MERFKQLADLYLQKSQDARKYCDEAALARAIAFEQARDMLTNVISGAEVPEESAAVIPSPAKQG